MKCQKHLLTKKKKINQNNVGVCVNQSPPPPAPPSPSSFCFLVSVKLLRSAIFTGRQPNALQQGSNVERENLATLRQAAALLRESSCNLMRNVPNDAKTFFSCRINIEV